MLDWLDGPTTAVILFFIGLTGMVLRKNMMITVIATSIMNTAIILAFVTMSSSTGHSPPMAAESVATSADPLPQALMITSVVIGVAVQAVCLVLILGYYRRHKTLDWDEARAIREGRLPAARIAPDGLSASSQGGLAPVADADPFARLRTTLAALFRPEGGTGAGRP